SENSVAHKRSSQKEAYKRSLQKELTKEAYKKGLQKKLVILSAAKNPRICLCFCCCRCLSSSQPIAKRPVAPSIASSAMGGREDPPPSPKGLVLHAESLHRALKSRCIERARFRHAGNSTNRYAFRGRWACFQRTRR